MARTNDKGGAEPVKIVIRKKTLKQIVGSGGGIAPGVAKMIGDTDKSDGRGDKKPAKPGKFGDYRDYLRT